MSIHTTRLFIEACLNGNVALARQLYQASNNNLNAWGEGYYFDNKPIRLLTEHEMEDGFTYAINSPTELLLAVRTETGDDPVTVALIHELFPETRRVQFITTVHDPNYPQVEMQYIISDECNLEDYRFMPRATWEHVAIRPTTYGEIIPWSAAGLDVYCDRDHIGTFIKIKRRDEIVYFYSDTDSSLQTGDASCEVTSTQLNGYHYLQIINTGDVESKVLIRWTPPFEQSG